MKFVNIFTVLSTHLAKMPSTEKNTSNETIPQPILSFLDSVCRGIGQVMLQNNRYAGLIFLAGIFYNSIMLGCAVLLGTIVSTATAMLLGADRSHVRAGLFGFNGALVAIALLYFLEPNSLTFAYVMFAAACSSIVMAALMTFLGQWNIPALTAPFVCTTLLFILACARFGRLHSTGVLPTAGLPKAATIDGIVTISTLAEGVLTGVAQVFFQDNFITGMLFLLGLLISSRKACGAAILGSLVGALVAWGMGAAEPAIRSGAFGFNCVLTAIVFSGGFFVLNTASAAYGTLAVVTTAVVFAAISAALEPLGMPALTSPFVLVVWLFLLASPNFLQIRKPSENNTLPTE